MIKRYKEYYELYHECNLGKWLYQSFGEWIYNQILDDIKDSLIEEQIGWYNPESERFCYLGDKRTWYGSRRRYTIPVYLPKPPKE